MEQEAQEQHHLLPETRQFVAETERAFNRRIVLEPVTNHWARATFSLGERGKPDRVRYDLKAVEHLDHLVIHELGHARLNYEAAASERFRATVDREAVHRAIGTESAIVLPWLSPERLAAWEQIAATWIVSTATSLPQDGLIESAIEKDGRFVALQEASLRLQAALLSQSFQANRRNILPEKAKHAFGVLDGAWLTWLARFLGQPELSRPVGESTLARPVNDVLEAIDSAESGALRDCRQATDRIAAQLGVRDWYSWRPFAP